MENDNLNSVKIDYGDLKEDKALEDESQKSITKRENFNNASSNFKNYYMDENYENYVVQYTGDILKALEPLDYASGYSSGQNYFAGVSVRKGRLQDLLKAVPEIINIEKSYPFTLSDLRIVNEAYDAKLFDKKPERLDGEGVIVGLIGTGIDFSNNRFMTQDKKSRVIAIWDQTIDNGPTPKTLGYGTEFSREQIAEAVRANNEGKDPFTIVGHKDDIGHGTALAGIIGGRNLGEGDDLVSIAPRCEFAIVKLKEAKRSTLEMNGISEEAENVYESTDIAAAIEYLSLLQTKLNKPMVVYVPLESNCGGHDGQTSLERYIELYNMRRGFVITSTTGDEADKGTHTSGNLVQKGDIGRIDIEVDERESKFCLSIWATRPDKVSVGIVAPTGEKIEKIQVPKIEEGVIRRKLGDSTIIIEHFIQEQSGGEQVIILIAENIKGGIWQINLYGEAVVNGRYDVWMHQRELLRGGTRFLKPDPYTTLTVPSTGRAVLCTSYYNRIDDSLPDDAGRGYTRDGRIKPTVVTGGTNLLTTGLNKLDVVASGPAMAGAILTGAVALLLEWGIVEKNDINLYFSKVSNYLIRGTIKKEGIVYPNPDWGYGILSCDELFKNIGRIHEKGIPKGYFSKVKTITIENLYFNIPFEIYKRLR